MNDKSIHTKLLSVFITGICVANCKHSFALFMELTLLEIKMFQTLKNCIPSKIRLFEDRAVRSNMIADVELTKMTIHTVCLFQCKL